MPDEDPLLAEPTDDGLNRPTPVTPATISYIPSRAEINTLVEIANAAAAAGLTPTPQVALVKMLFGREVGISPQIAIGEIDLIPAEHGIKASLNARTQVAMIRRRGLGDVRLLSTDEQGAEVIAWRSDDPQNRMNFRFGRVDAERADLLRKKNYRCWPAEMYVARACSRAVHALFQEVFLGLSYTPDELGAETDEQGRALLAAPEATTGVKRREAPPATSSDVAAATEIVQTARSTESPPRTEAAEAFMAPDRTRADIKTLAGMLKLSADEWNQVKARMGPAEGRPWSATQLATCRTYLRRLHELTWLKTELKIPDDKWADALRRRGALKLCQLSWANAAELANKLAESLTPFNRQRYVATVAQQLGTEPDEYACFSGASFQGNPSPPAP